ncbi:MAG: homoserine kinase [Solirubrobacteraceae bacterium]
MRAGARRDRTGRALLTPARGRHLLIRVPASSANLGPGFDVLAAALGCHLQLELLQTGTFGVQSELAIPRDRSNLVVRAFELLAPADEFEFRIASQIPLCGGLGSSAAAIVAGLSAAEHLLASGGDVGGLATELEGHPDNVAAALRGGLIVCDRERIHRFEAPSGLEAVLVLPDRAVPTSQARAALPASVPIADAVFNVAHTAMLTLGLARGDWELIAAGLDDRLHQPHRAHLYPRSAELRVRARSLGALGATISSAGPSVLFWCRSERTGEVMAALEREARGWARVMRMAFETRGVEVREL